MSMAFISYLQEVEEVSRQKQTRRHDFTPAMRRRIEDRDMGCIFCRMGYHMPANDYFGTHIFSIMHYIPRSQGGLGIEQNAAVGCQYHHNMLDNDNKGRRAEMLEKFKDYLQRVYPGWNEEDLIYNKWKEMEVCSQKQVN